tara:strand:- start:372 stop:662 length:291 start_codon:yes stop_codon:yes gene_type:complete
MKEYLELEEKEYMEKQLKTAQAILPILVSQQSIEYMTDVRKRASVIYNGVAIAGEVLKEVGFIKKGMNPNGENAEDRTAIRKLSEILQEEQKKDEE